MKQKTEHQKGTVENIYQLNGTVPIAKAIPFGLQHILAMFVANIAPILIVANACGLSDQNTAMLIQSAMLIAGIGTLVQLFPIFHKIGSGLPIVMGISFTFVSILCFVGTQYGYGYFRFVCEILAETDCSDCVRKCRNCHWIFAVVGRGKLFRRRQRQ